MNLNKEILTNAKEFTFECPSCKQKFIKNRAFVVSALAHKQRNVYCSSICAKDATRVSKEVLIQRLRNFYEENQRVPTFQDFKLASIFRRSFGNWTNALKEANLLELRGSLCNSIPNSNANSWQRQSERAEKLKLELIELKGGKCLKCGYSKNYAALCFHYRDPLQKSISLDKRSLGNTKLEKIMLELNKCDLLCANCHTELHNPECDLEV